MDEPSNELPLDIHTGGEELEPKELFRLFPDVDSFADAIKASLGFDFDFSSVLELNTDFIQSTDKYLLLNIKEFNGEMPDNILLLT